MSARGFFTATKFRSGWKKHASTVLHGEIAWPTPVENVGVRQPGFWLSRC
jgi:hypothetical protein